MSADGIAAKKQWMTDWFLVHPDSRTVTIAESAATFPAVFDYAYMVGDEDKGNVNQQKRVPHLTFLSDYAVLLLARSTKVDIEGQSKQFTVYKVSADLTEETFQAEAWLI
jgi:hypothetical protein